MDRLSIGSIIGWFDYRVRSVIDCVRVRDARLVRVWVRGCAHQGRRVSRTVPTCVDRLSIGSILGWFDYRLRSCTV